MAKQDTSSSTRSAAAPADRSGELSRAGLWPFYIVLNNGSGRTETDERRDTIRTILDDAGRLHHIEIVRKPQDLGPATERAIEWARVHQGAVVAAGGDGTVNAVATQVLPTGLPFGVLPQGTFNYFGRTHGIPTDTAEAVHALLKAQLRPVQAGMCNERIFLVNGSMGLYPEVLSDRETMKQRLGRSRPVALLAALFTLLRHHRDWVIKLDVNGEMQTVVTPTLFVGNNALQLAQTGIPGGPLLDTGRLVAIMVRPMSRLAMLGLLLRGALGNLGDADKVDSLAFTRLEVTPRLPHKPRRLKVATDGEIVWMRTPLVFRPAPKPLQLLAPAPQE
jgi:diacylglycerol kinase family enzyme